MWNFTIQSGTLENILEFYQWRWIDFCRIQIPCHSHITRGPVIGDPWKTAYFYKVQKRYTGISDFRVSDGLLSFQNLALQWLLQRYRCGPIRCLKTCSAWVGRHSPRRDRAAVWAECLYIPRAYFFFFIKLAKLETKRQAYVEKSVRISAESLVNCDIFSRFLFSLSDAFFRKHDLFLHNVLQIFECKIISWG
jgi:hypothetical protein